ncbi:hypothetical protein SAMN02745126_06514 [Enhydrobacter aerosaccus]|uniref:SGNH/GDSL hydrolase family protein n=1 Tax=Enhydrobacter aerosaccus TaxID=225324 RepID=A0A1T4TMG8_9HYPH|nr:hypothetical protein [Enhydrobacter aerosaccus]SKA41675.1 hypothetical protein SAMN02745126_06514 [Enhydrobacter aerosaccus]
MAGSGRNLWIAAGLVAVLAIGTATLPTTGWVSGLAVLLGLAGVVLLRGNGWRNGSLLVAAVALAVSLLDVFAGLLAPTAHGMGLVKTFDPWDWLMADPELGYRPRPGDKVQAGAFFDGAPVFRVTYTIDGEGMRLTPPAPAGADTYLFVGDSYMFGQGLADDETLPAQFAKAVDFKVRTANFSAPGYGPNHLVRAFETGRFDHLKDRNLKAVVTWIIPADLSRVTGDESWLGSSPRYAIDDGVPRFTGTFTEHRWSDPLDGLHYLAGQHFPFIAAIGMRQRQDRQVALFSALLLRLQELARDRLGVPLLVLYNWPDEDAPPGRDEPGRTQPALVKILTGLRDRGLSLMSAEKPTWNKELSKLVIPHDGHPSAYANALIAEALKQRLLAP